MLGRLTFFCALATLNAASTSRRVVIIDLDGIRQDTFEQAYLQLHLASFERILGPVHNGAGFGSALVFDHATTIFPTVTMAAQASIFTGVFPGLHGIPGNAWFERMSAQLIDYMTPGSMACVYGGASLFTGCAGGLANRHLTAPTLYEVAARGGKTSTVVFNQYYKGATTPVLPSIEDAFAFLEGYDVDYAAFDTRMMDRALESLERDGLPDILTVYFAGADGIAHQQGIAAQFAYLEDVVDPQLGRLLDALALHDKWWNTNTLFVITADHGRTDAVYHSEDLDLAYRISLDLNRVAGSAGPALLVPDGGMAYIYVPAGEDAAPIAHELVFDPLLESAVDAVLLRHAPANGYRLVPRGHVLRRLPPQWAALVNALDSPRIGDILVILKEGHYFGNNGSGSNHGSIFAGDLGVPLILAQGGVVAGRSSEPVSNTGIAASIAAYLDVPPEGWMAPLPDVSFQNSRPVVH